MSELKPDGKWSSDDARRAFDTEMRAAKERDEYRRAIASLTDALTDAQSVLATLIDADSIGKVASSTVYFQAKAAESKARAALSRATEGKS